MVGFQKKQKNRINGLLLAGIGTGAALGLITRARLNWRMDFRGRVVIITGGSRGLGLQMARLLAAEGAKLALLSRNEPELFQAQRELQRMGARVLAIPCDVSIREQIEDAIDQVVDHFGRVDVLVNNAGVIQVGPVDHMQLKDYEDALAIHFWGPLYAMLKVIPVMRQHGGGRIVNITSIGGQVAIPHLAPYSASKFALTGLSDAFRAELAKDNIHISTVAPGLMRTGSYYHGNFKGQNKKEFAWFTLMAATPLTAMQSKRAARQVITSARYAIPKRTLTLQARLLAVVEEIAPNLVARVMEIVNRYLPDPVLMGDEPRTGFESRSRVAPSWATRLGDKAAERNNEMIAERELD